MAWFKFTKDHDFKASPGSTIAYKAGMHLRLNKAALESAKAAGAGEETEHSPNSGDAKDGTQVVRVPQVRG